MARAQIPKVIPQDNDNQNNSPFAAFWAEFYPWQRNGCYKISVRTDNDIVGGPGRRSFQGKILRGHLQLQSDPIG
jgi:hypothetical protein